MTSPYVRFSSTTTTMCAKCGTSRGAGTPSTPRCATGPGGAVPAEVVQPARSSAAAHARTRRVTCPWCPPPPRREERPSDALENRLRLDRRLVLDLLRLRGRLQDGPGDHD